MQCFGSLKLLSIIQHTVVQHALTANHASTGFDENDCLTFPQRHHVAGTNHFGHWALTHGLVDKMKSQVQGCHWLHMYTDAQYARTALFQVCQTTTSQALHRTRACCRTFRHGWWHCPQQGML